MDLDETCKTNSLCPGLNRTSMIKTWTSLYSRKQDKGRALYILVFRMQIYYRNDNKLCQAQNYIFPRGKPQEKSILVTIK